MRVLLYSMHRLRHRSWEIKAGPPSTAVSLGGTSPAELRSGPLHCAALVEGRVRVEGDEPDAIVLGMQPCNLQLALLAICCASLVPATGTAETYAYGAAELSGLTPAGHGILIIDADFGERDQPAPRLTLNTDTLTAVMEDIPAPGDGIRLDVGVSGEAAIAGLLTDYYVAGERLPEYGFEASWAGPFVQLRRQIDDRHFLLSRTHTRRWWFGLPGQDYPNVLLPKNYTSVEQTVAYTYWGFDPDPSHSDAHRLFWRYRGFGFGAEATAELRSNSAQWVTRLPTRNVPSRRQFRARQWAAVGGQLGTSIRAQVKQTARVGFGEDDMTRGRIGGFNPYSVDLAGAPWPAFLSSRVVSGHASLHWNLYGDAELGVVVDHVRLSDPRRLGLGSEWGGLTGGGLFLDHRAGPWQIDIRIGALAPSKWMREAVHVGAFGGFGRSF